MSGQTTFGWDLDNKGKVETQQGSLTFTSKVTGSKTFTAAAGTTINYQSDVDLNTGAVLNGAGTHRGTGSGTIKVNADVEADNFDLDGNGNTMTGPGPIHIKVMLRWNGLAALNGLKIFGDTDAVFNWTGSNLKTISDSTIDNYGTINFDALNRLIMNQSSTLNNYGVFNYSSANNAGIDQETGAPSTVNNFGTFNLDNNSTAPYKYIAPRFIQTSGRLNLRNGYIRVFRGYTLRDGALFCSDNTGMESNNNVPVDWLGGSVSTGSQFTIISPGGVNNSGSILTPGGVGQTGTINITFGNYTQSGNGVLDVDINGTSPGAQYDQLKENNNATLGGRLDVHLGFQLPIGNPSVQSNGFAPQAGNTFTIMTYGAHTGTFTRINGLNSIGSDRLLLPQYGSTSFDLVTSPINIAQNGPVINSASTNANSTTIQGNFTGTPNTSYTLHLFTNPGTSNPTCDNANQSLVGSSSITTIGTGSASFTIILSTPLAVGQFVTAIATDANFTSSKFSPCAQVSAGGSTVQFSAASYNVGESSVTASAFVTRAGDATGTTTVDYTTVDDPAAVRCDDTTTMPGVAFARCDYATKNGTLTFAPGETQKEITVSIINDAHVEGTEIFNVLLRNPAGALLGAQATATVMIIDNDAAGQPNPIFTTPFFVRQQYLDFLSREPEAGEPWSGVLNRCPNVDNLDPQSPSAGCDRINVSASFFGSPEFQLKGFFVYRFYKLAFNRLPAYTEIAPDMAGVTGTTPQEVFTKKANFTNAFAQRQEFTAAYSAQANAAYVTALMSRYQLTSITTPDPAQPDGTNKVTLTSTDLTSRLDAGTLTRAQVLRAIADSDQVGAAEFNRAFVAMQYYGYLRRTPDTSGYNAWLNYLTTHPTDFRTMVNGFMNSIEYRLRFGVGQ